MTPDENDIPLTTNQRLEFSGRLTYEDQSLFEHRGIGRVANLAGACWLGWQVWGWIDRGMLFDPRMGALQLILLLGLGCVALQFWYKTIKRRRAKQASVACKGVYQACDYTVTPEDLTLKTKEVVTSISWSAFESHKFAPEYLVIKPRNSVSNYLFLKRWFSDESDWKSLQTTIEQGITENGSSN